MNKKTKIFYLGLLSLMIVSLFIPIINALPTGPIVQYVSNTTAAPLSVNRSVDEKGTITTLNLNALQQDYKWKAYVGNVSGRLALDDANGKSIYDWTLGTVTGEVYVSRASSVSWSNVACVNQTIIDNEQTAMGMLSSQSDSLNSTFRYTAHDSLLVGVTSISSSTCRSTATYINDTAQTVDENAYFQEVLLADTTTNSLIYTTFIEAQHLGFDGNTNHDFQLIVAENESATAPLTYFFYVELG